MTRKAGGLLCFMLLLDNLDNKRTTVTTPFEGEYALAMVESRERIWIWIWMMKLIFLHSTYNTSTREYHTRCLSSLQAVGSKKEGTPTRVKSIYP